MKNKPDPALFYSMKYKKIPKSRETLPLKKLFPFEANQSESEAALLCFRMHM
jgi:hypothetical protein